jgi:hypothetical protein
MVPMRPGKDQAPRFGKIYCLVHPNLSTLPLESAVIRLEDASPLVDNPIWHNLHTLS